jgi:hypothetical protein
MTRQVIIDYWMDKARADLESAWDNFRGRWGRTKLNAHQSRDWIKNRAVF